LYYVSAADFRAKKAPDEGLFLPLLQKYAGLFVAAFDGFPAGKKTDK